MRTLLYGRYPVYEALRAGRRHCFGLRIAEGVQPKGVLQDILALCRERKIPVQTLARSTLDAQQPGNQGVVLEASDYPYADYAQVLANARRPGQTPLLLMLDTLQDPQNLGVLLRSAEAVGVHGVFMPQHQQVAVTPAVVNASSGAVEHLLLARLNLAQAIQQLKQDGFWVVGLEGSEDARLPGEMRLDGPLALVLGSEGEGLRRLVRDSCDWLMRLPMRGQVASLNAAAAGSIALYLTWQARGFQ